MLRFILPFLALCCSTISYAIPPVLNYAGQVRVVGEPFTGTGYVKFAFVNASGNFSYWSNDGTSSAGSEPNGSISVDVRGGLYSILLGNTAIPGMNAIDPILFQQNSDIHIRVWFNDGERGFQHLQPDRPFASVPYALAAGNVGIAPGSVTVAQLDQSIVEYLQPEIVAQPSSRSAVAGSKIELTVETYGRNLGYQWLRNGEILDGQTQPTLKFESFDPTLHAGDYILETTNPFGTVSSDVISISEIIVPSLAVRALFPEQHDMLISFDVMEEVEVLFTAHGPSLETPNASEDPDLYLQDVHKNLIHSNDDWDLSTGTLESFGVYNLNGLESAILHVLAPGSYSVRARDLGNIAAEMEIQLHTLGDASGNVIQNIRVHAYLGLEDGSAQFQTASFAFDYMESLDFTSFSVLDDSISSLLLSGSSDLGEPYLDVVENQPIGTTIQEFDTTEFPGEEISFSLVSGPGDDNNSLFNFDSIGALKTADVLDYEASNNLRIRLRIADERNATLEGSYLVTVTDDPTDNDKQSPVIELVGDSLFIHPVNTPWVDPGFTASDETDGILSDSVNVTGELDLNTTGTYTLTYSVTDAAGNEASITRIVNVEKNNDYRGVDISSMDFSGQDLSDALFDSTTIFSNGSSGVNFSGTGLKLDNLSGEINFYGVNLDGVDLRGSDLSLALFDEYTVVTNANLAGTGALFPYFTVDISGANVAGLDFTQSEGLVMSYSTILTEYDDELGKYNGANISRNGSGGYYSSYSGRGLYENINGLPLDLRGVNVAGLDLSRMYREQIYSVSFDSDTIFSTDELGGASVGLVDEDRAPGWGGYEGISLPNLSGPIDLRGVNLSYVDLTGSDLSQAIINSSTCLIGANLYGTGLALPWDFDIYSGSLDIRGANVAGLNLSGFYTGGYDQGPKLRVSYETILSDGSSGADISGCSFAENSEGLPSDFRGVNITAVNLQIVPVSEWESGGPTWFDSSTIFTDGTYGAILGKPEFGFPPSNRTFILPGLSGPVDLRGVDLRGVDLSGNGLSIDSDLSEALFNPSVTLFVGANFSGTNANFPVGEYDFSNANITGIDLTGCTVYLSEQSVITGANFTNANLLEDSWGGWGALSNMDFSGVNLTGVNLSNLNLSNAVFDSNTVFSDTIYSESSTYFPDGFDPTQYPGLIAQ